MNTSRIPLVITLLVLTTALALADPLGSAFTYQGRLSDSGSPATGLYDFQFILCDAATSGAAFGTNAVSAVPVTNGLYTVALDFGASAFDGNARWLALSVRTNGGIIWTGLTPSLPLTPTPYAIRATTAGGVSGVIPDSQLSDNIARLNGTNVFTGPVTAPSFSGSGSSLSGVAPASGSSNYVAKAGDTMTGSLNFGPASVLQQSGNIGVGTSNPGASIDVVGWFRVDSSGPPYPGHTGLELGVSRAYSQFPGYSWIQSHDYALALNPLGNNVGIGTAIPLDALNVVSPVATPFRGNVTLYDSTAMAAGVGGQLEFGGLQDGSTYTEWAGIQGAKADAISGHYGGNLQLRTRAYGQDPQLHTRMILDDQGNVGIGTTSPASKLHLGNLGFNDGLILDSRGNGGNDGGNIEWRTQTDRHWNIDQYGTHPDLRFFTADASDANGGTVMTLSDSGNVGIGTSAPQSPLEVNGSVRTTRPGTPNQYISQYVDVAGAHIRASAASGAISLGVSGDYLSVLDVSGNVGIGTTSPNQGKLVVVDSNAATSVTDQTPGTVAIVNSDLTAGNFSLVTFNDGNSLVATAGIGTWNVAHAPASTTAVGDLALFTKAVGATTLSERMRILSSGNVGIGTASPSAKLEVAGNLKISGTGNSITTPVLSITGGSDVAEPFPLAAQEIPKGSVVVIDDEHPGQLKLSTEPYDQRVAGIVSGANGINPGITLSQQGALEGGQNVALSGRVYVLADAANAPIKPGDLLTTSPVPGHAMKVTDHAKAQGAILGKAMSRLPEGRGLVLVLVTLQ